MIRSITFVLFLTLLSLSVTSCGSTNVAGATSETTNGIISSVAVTSDGQSIAGARVIFNDAHEIRDIDDTTIPLETVTDSNGAFEIEHSDSNEILIEIVAPDGKRAQARLLWDSLAHQYSTPEAVPLSKPGSLFGEVVHSNETTIWVQVEGLRRTVPVVDGIFRIDSLPAGTIFYQIVSEDSIYEESSPIDIKSSQSRDAGLFMLSTGIEYEKAIVRSFLLDNGINDVELDHVITVERGHIVEIYLDGYGISTIPPELGKLRLRKLSLARNSITTLPEELGALTSLTYLDLSGNGLVELPEVIHRFSSLESLDLGRNELTTLPESITELHDISWLYVGYNRLTNLPTHMKIWVDTYSGDDTWFMTQKW